MMALPIMLFGLIGFSALVLIVLGSNNFDSIKGTAFISLAGLILLMSGALLWSEGLQLDTTETITEAGGVFTMSYTVLTATEGSALWMFASTLFYGGLLVMLVGFGKTISLFKSNREDVEETY